MAVRGGATVAGRRKRPEQAARGPKQRFTVHIPPELAERVRDACYCQPDLTLAAFVEKALDTALIKLQKQRNKGKPFPARKGDLKRGRPIGT